MPSGTARIDTHVLRRLWAEGMRQADIAKIFGCSPSAVSIAVKRNGLPDRKLPRVVIRAVPPTKPGRTPYLSKPARDPELDRTAPFHTYANVQEMVGRGMTQRQALQEFHRRRA